MKYGAGVQEDQKFDTMNLRSYLVIRQYLLTTTTTTKIVILCCNGDFVRKRWRICRFRNRCNFIEICRSSYAQFSESEQKANMYYSPRNGWFRKDDVCAGYIISLTCALRSLTPTSIPVTWRDRLHQGRIQQESDPVGCVGALQREQQGMLEYSFSRLFVPWNVRSRTIRSRERINTADLFLLGPFVPWTVHSLELSFQVPWTFPATDHSFICQQSSTWSLYIYIYMYIYIYLLNTRVRWVWCM